MKVLYIAHYREASGWGRAAREYIRALLTVGVDVVCRPVVLAGSYQPEEWLLACEEKPLVGCEVCIQHVLPHYLVYSGKFRKNICLYATETSNFISSGWANYINLMDEAWVICTQQLDASVDSGVEIPINIVEHTTDITKYEKPRKKMDFQGDFVFYTISEWNTRKNIPAIIKAFHTEFDPSEPVRLLIKTNNSSFSSEELAKEVLRTCNKIKSDIRLYPNLSDYKGDYINTGYISEDELLDLHYSCDSFISASYGEAWNYPAFDAMAFGKYPICNNVGGMADFISHGSTGYLVENTDTVVSSVNDTLPGLFTGKEMWKAISIPKLSMMMRNIYESRNGKFFNSFVQQSSKEQIKEYSYESIGNLMIELIGE